MAFCEVEVEFTVDSEGGTTTHTKVMLLPWGVGEQIPMVVGVKEWGTRKLRGETKSSEFRFSLWRECEGAFTVEDRKQIHNILTRLNQGNEGFPLYVQLKEDFGSQAPLEAKYGSTNEGTVFIKKLRQFVDQELRNLAGEQEKELFHLRSSLRQALRFPTAWERLG